jgi:hypothetical protein
MNLRHLLACSISALVIAGCESGDINLTPTNIDNSTTTGGGGGGGAANPCAAYTTSGGTVRQGTYDGTNCTYSSSFVSFANPLRVDLDIPAFAGIHIFQDVLAVGPNLSAGAVPAGGTGPVLTIAPGNTLAFSDNTDYVVINRGSQIIADGTAAAPITFTSVTDAVLNNVTPEAVQQWGGIVLNGNGITNNCTDAQRASNDCHVQSEGQPVYYGGNNNTESSGVLRYVVVKHTGAEVAPDDELNGITFNAVGSGTIVSYLETYSTYDDGIEFFGGAVDIDHYVAVYVRDDTIDFSDGYVGTVDTALIVQSQMDGNRCIEGDNIGETRAAQGVALDTLPMTNPTITNMTCIVSAQDVGTHADVSEGPTLRRGPQMQLRDSIVFGAYQDDVGNNNECFELAADGVTNNWAQAGATTAKDVLIACEDAWNNNLPNGDTALNWLRNTSTVGANYALIPDGAGGFIEGVEGNVVIEAVDLFANTSLAVLDSFYTATALVDHTGAAITMTPASGQLGAVTRANDWTAGWTYGLHPGSQGQPLWFGNP